MLTNRELIAELQRLPLDAAAIIMSYDRINGWEHNRVDRVHHDAEYSPSRVVLRAEDPTDGEEPAAFQQAGYYKLEIYSWTKHGDRLVHGVWSGHAPNETTARDRAICEYAAGNAYRLCAHLLSFVPSSAACLEACLR